VSLAAPPALTGIVRQLPRAAVALVAALALTACGSDGGANDDAAPSDSEGTDGAFPITVEHKYGTTEIEEEPLRVVTLGLSDQDTVLALGITPVGAVDWFKEEPYGKWPWTDELWGDSRPEIVGERDVYREEKILDLEPDLIIAQYSGMKKEQYDTLSEIAPVIAQPMDHEDYQAPWQVMTRQIGKALGKDAETEELIAGIDARFAEVREDHPEWAELTVAVGEPYEPGVYSAFSPQDPKMVFLAEMGFTPSETYLEALGDELIADLSFERFDVMDADRAVWLGSAETEAALREEPLYQLTAVNKEGRDVFLPYENPDIGAALSFNTVLSIPYAIDEIVPLLEAVD
jgi:iron complex transport system substrate-binding protein